MEEMSVWRKTPKSPEESEELTLIHIIPDPRGEQGICVTKSGDFIRYPLKYLTIVKPEVHNAAKR
jgi:hypothetical protein